MSVFSQNKLDANLKLLRDFLIRILGDLIGKYEVLNASKAVISEIPAVIVTPPIVENYRMKKMSGIEVVINRGVDLQTEPMLGAVALLTTYKVRLVQYNVNSSLQLAIARMIESGCFDLGMIRCQPFQQLGDGFAYEQCIIDIKTDRYLHFSM